MNRHLLLVDGSNLMARAWFTMRTPSLDQLPEKVGRMLASAVRRWEPTHLVVALDSPSSFRRDGIPGYKADRKDRRGPGTAELTDALRPAFTAWNVAVREVKDLEADDVIAALVRKAVEIECAVSVLSKDTDLLQLVHDAVGVRVLWPEGKGDGETVFDDAAVRTYLSEHKDFQAPIGPEHLLDLRTIAGGKDNLPRIEIRGPGIKPPYGFTTRRAALLLSEGATLDSLCGGDASLLSERELGWMDACRESALERRELLRLRADAEPTGTGSAAVVDQSFDASVPRELPAAAPVSAPTPIGRSEVVKVPCAGGCGRMEVCEPHHDPKGVHCFPCGVRAGREDAKRRREERSRQVTHV